MLRAGFSRYCPKGLVNFVFGWHRRKQDDEIQSISSEHGRGGLSFWVLRHFGVDKKGTPRVMQRTARKKLQGACRRIKDWIKENRHLKGINS
jgi:hypothetical protein